MKQKLDCVLQLARSVSPDFNNALTGVLAHTSLLLGKAEAEHPWRRSLIEVEKSAARAAGIAGELALFSFGRKESRKAPARNLNAVASRCVEVFRNAQGARIAWNVTLERSTLFESRFDEVKVQQAITKIMENAVESFAANANGQVAIQTRNVELTQATQDHNDASRGWRVCLGGDFRTTAWASIPKRCHGFSSLSSPPNVPRIASVWPWCMA